MSTRWILGLLAVGAPAWAAPPTKQVTVTPSKPAGTATTAVKPGLFWRTTDQGRTLFDGDKQVAVFTPEGKTLIEPGSPYRALHEHLVFYNPATKSPGPTLMKVEFTDPSQPHEWRIVPPEGGGEPKRLVVKKDEQGHGTVYEGVGAEQWPLASVTADGHEEARDPSGQGSVYRKRVNDPKWGPVVIKGRLTRAPIEALDGATGIEFVEDMDGHPLELATLDQDGGILKRYLFLHRPGSQSRATHSVADDLIARLDPEKGQFELRPIGPDQSAKYTAMTTAMDTWMKETQRLLLESQPLFDMVRVETAETGAGTAKTESGITQPSSSTASSSAQPKTSKAQPSTIDKAKMRQQSDPGPDSIETHSHDGHSHEGHSH